MSDIAIRVENLSKRYRIGVAGGVYRYKALRDTLTDGLYAPFRAVRSLVVRKPRSEGQSSAPTDGGFIWALNDVSLEVKQGEALGIIGRNGAGKTTLLKILSRVTEPTRGMAEIRGRVGSLLEIGTGFHPELTGRENVYFYGALLGMSRGEIRRRFDEIIEFAGVEKFVETPVKRYSSGMYMRLAFAVAAHLEPEILLVDEVLAVGDAAFQKKCLGKMGDMSRQGRTVLFVSHNMPAIQRLCQTAYLLEQGAVVASGSAPEVVDAYYKAAMQTESGAPEARAVPEGTVRFVAWLITDGSAGDAHSCYTGEPCTITLRLAARRTVREANFGIALWTDDGTLVWAMRSLDRGGQCVPLGDGVYNVEFEVPAFPLRPGRYQILVSANDLREGPLDAWYAQPQLTILPRDESGLPPQWQGLLNMSGRFRLSPSQHGISGQAEP